ncbi:enoyl-CoA hydratase/isomerase family protein [Bartonella sp. DGB2]|uniref:enoyl-CoA hydratase/isomerase family protein n=1 Tax=Bartonella sp. DGB2 TaxID=3388426 RepID=UPI00398FDA95
MNVNERNDIIFGVEGGIGLITLTRPSALNALTHAMVKAMYHQLQVWENEPKIRAVLVAGEGRAFCAGGDVVAAYRSGKAGAPPYEYFRDEYKLNACIGRYKKPYISLLDGIFMGGGAGISVHGSHRIVTENTLFAMPEGAIGFFPDVGASYFLNRLSGGFGLYLGLIGARLRWGDCVQSGIATHAVAHADIAQLRARLIAGEAIDSLLAHFQKTVHYETSSLDRAVIAACFKCPDLDQIIKNLHYERAQGHALAQHCLDAMAKQAPVSLKVFCAQMRQSANLSLEECLKMEYRIACRFLQEHNFYEGVRAVLVDKDNKPQWQPATCEAIDEAQLVAYFEPLTHELDLA